MCEAFAVCAVPLKFLEFIFQHLECRHVEGTPSMHHWLKEVSLIITATVRYTCSTMWTVQIVSCLSVLRASVDGCCLIYF